MGKAARPKCIIRASKYIVIHSSLTLPVVVCKFEKPIVCCAVSRLLHARLQGLQNAIAYPIPSLFALSVGYMCDHAMNLQRQNIYESRSQVPIVGSEQPPRRL